MNFDIPRLPDPLLTEAYEAAASKSVLAAVNDKIFFGYFSVCGDGKGHGGNTTFPGLDWGQSAEALLWLGREDVVRASWEYVKSFQRADGLLPFAILPDHAGKAFDILGYPVQVDPNGGLYRHWEPGNAFLTLADVTYIQVADTFFRATGDLDWLRRQAETLRRAVGFLEGAVDANGLVRGGGFYMERPARHRYEGVTQCYNANAHGIAAGLFDRIGDGATAARCRGLADRITAAFRREFWEGGQCFEYITPDGRKIATHGLTDADWIAVGSGTASPEQVAVVWPRLRDASDFVYDGIPTGVATRPEAYEDWELSSDRHDIAAMGRVWYLEAWARTAMGDGEGLVASLRKVAETGKINGWSWCERYYSERTGYLGLHKMQWYVEYPACLVRIVNRFLLGVEYGLDGSLSLAPTVPAEFWRDGFGQRLAWAGRVVDFRFAGRSLAGTYEGATAQRVRVRPFPGAAGQPTLRIDGSPAAAVAARGGWLEFDLPPSPKARPFELTA